MPMTTALSAPAAPRLDAIRILGISSAVAMNLIAAGLLLMPMQALPPPPPPDAPTVWIIPAARPPAPLPPPTVPVARPAPANPAPARIPAIARTPADPPVVVAEGTLQASAPVEAPVDAGPGAGPVGAGPATTGGAPTQLEYAIAPAPPYPRESLRNGDEGLVVLQVLVDVDGRPLEVEVAEGSGHRLLDRAARRHVLAHWRFRPAIRDGRPVQAVGLVPIQFSLQ